MCASLHRASQSFLSLSIALLLLELHVTKLFSTWLVREKALARMAVEVAVCNRHGSTQACGASRPRNPEALLRPRQIST
ncbi:hypothetical protein J3F84DRAFT_373809 [Trichoderma pleuroticola]